MAKRNEKVTVFGAGVAGLTAAHELITRGYEVEVIDPDFNEHIHPHTFDRGIGGMARSQWACMVHDREQGDMHRLVPANERLLDEVIVFEGGKPKHPERAAELAGKAKKLGAGVRVRIPIGAAGDAAAAWVRDHIASIDVTRETLPPKFDGWVMFEPLKVLPAEHGFRFFPSFYRHLFDTMKRTPIDRPSVYENGRATTYDNLNQTDGLGFARAFVKSFMIPRTQIKSSEEARQILRKVLGRLDYTFEDIGRFELKLLKYMTSSTARREKQYEVMSWGDFVEQWKYSKVSREHIEYGPAMSAALRGSKSDARTQGSISLQLMAPELGQTGGRIDGTLDGPSSPAWLDHWHDFLVSEDVEFRRDRLKGFDADMWPVMEHKQIERDENRYFVLALSLDAMAKLVVDLGDRADSEWKRVTGFLGDGALDVAAPPGPLQHLSGIQYYFDTEVRFWRGHTQYLDSKWGLTSIAQPQFWVRPRLPTDDYRSILSVDIGIFDREYEGKTAWSCTAQEIAELAWKQIHDHMIEAFREEYGNDVAFPRPFAYSLDHNLIFNEHGRIAHNKSMFLVNKTSEYAGRPGALDPKTKMKSAYKLIDRYVLAGTFMKTFTRLTSMEGANESARHAVNALLRTWKAACDRCEIWDPEENEPPDLAWLKELDEDLLKRGLPHFVDILSWDEVPEAPDLATLLAPLRRRWK